MPAGGDEAQQIAGGHRGRAIVRQRVVVERVVLEHRGIEHRGDAASDIVDEGKGRNTPGAHPEERYTVAGRLVSRRGHGKTAFLDLRDLSGTIQVVLRVDSLGEHAYERIKPEEGIYYFILGSSGKLAKDDFHRSDVMETSFDRDRTFMLIEVAGDKLHFQTISRSGQTVDSGAITRQPEPAKAAAAGN